LPEKPFNVIFLAFIKNMNVVISNMFQRKEREIAKERKEGRKGGGKERRKEEERERKKGRKDEKEREKTNRFWFKMGM
jgi:hypothetical protein